MPTLAKAISTTTPVLWPALLSLGSVAVGAALTFLVQRWGLTYQTRQQRELRRADAQRAALLALRDLLGEVDDALRRIRHIPWDAYAQTGQWEPTSSIHPEVQALRSLMYRLRLRAVEIEDKDIRITVEHLYTRAWLEVTAQSETEASENRDKVTRAQSDMVRLLGERLRSLP